MTSIGVTILLGLMLAVLFGSRRVALIGLVAGILYLTLGQQISVLGLNLFAIRILVVAAFVRVVVRKELSSLTLNQLDKTLLLFLTYTLLVFLARSNEGQVFEIGRAVDGVLCYFTFRALLRTTEELGDFLRALPLLLLPYVAIVITESYTTHNPFTAMGGIRPIGPEHFRDGRLRAVGSFAHPSLLGTLGGTFLALYIGAWLSGRSRFIALIAIASCLLVVWASNSGGPSSCVAVAILGWTLWGFRAGMRWVRLALAGLILSLALIMKAPIWYLLARLSQLTGGDGYHRAYLMDIAFQNLDKWWLAGMSIRDTIHWFPYVNPTTGGADMTNQYLVFGLTAGLGSMFLFILLLVRAFATLGTALAATRVRGETGAEALYLWGLGVMLAVHVFNWLGIPYFDQTYVLWLFQLAAISSITEHICPRTAENGSTVRDPRPARVRLKRPRFAHERAHPGRRGYHPAKPE